MDSAVTNRGAGESDYHHQENFRTHKEGFTCRIAPKAVTIVTRRWSALPDFLYIAAATQIWF
jgi:hypothetical protein